MKIFRTMLCTLCQNCLSYSICNYVASTALMGTVFAFYLFFLCIFINYYNYRVNHRKFLWLVVANKCQMSSDINILHHSYQEWLKYQTFTAFQVKFHIFGSIINFPLTGNDLCHSQPNGIFFHYF